MKWKFAMGGGKDERPEEARYGGPATGTYGGNSGGSAGGNTRGNSGGTRSAFEEYLPSYHRPYEGPAAMGGMPAGYVSPSMPSGYAGADPRNQHMGFTADIYPSHDGSAYSGDDGDMEMRRDRSRRTGRFVHRAALDGKADEETSARYGRRHDKRHDDSDEGDTGSYQRDAGDVDAMMDDMRGMVRRLEKRLARLESHGREGGSKADRGGHEDGDNKDDDPWLEKLLNDKEVRGKLLKQLPRVFQDAVEVIRHPPATWPPYLEQEDYAGIFSMEAKELQMAIDQWRAGTGTLSDILREVEHTVAAAAQLKAHLLQAEAGPAEKNKIQGGQP